MGDIDDVNLAHETHSPCYQKSGAEIFTPPEVWETAPNTSYLFSNFPNCLFGQSVPFMGGEARSGNRPQCKHIKLPRAALCPKTENFMGRVGYKSRCG